MNQQRWKRTMIGAACTAAIAATATAACVFTWNGNGSTDKFTDGGNWVDQITPCPFSNSSPNFFDDTAVFPDNLGTAWAVDLDATVHIRQVDCAENISFVGNATLTTDTLNIAPTGGDIEITVGGTAEIAVP